MGAPARDPYLDAGMEGYIRNLAVREYWRVAGWYGPRETGLDDLIQDGYMCFARCRARYVDRVELPSVSSIRDRDLDGARNAVVGDLVYRRAAHRRPREDLLAGDPPTMVLDAAGTPYLLDPSAQLLPAEPTEEHRRWMMDLVRTTFERYLRHVVAGHVRYGAETPASQLGRDDPDAPDAWDAMLPSTQQDPSLLVLLRSLPAEMQQLVALLVGDGAEALGFARSRFERRVLPSGALRLHRRGRRRLRETTNEHYCRLLGLDPARRDVRAELAAVLRGEDAEIPQP